MVETTRLEPRPGKVFLNAVLNKDHDKIVQMVCDKDISVNRLFNCQGRYRMTPLCLVIQHCYKKDLVQALIKAGADINADGWVFTYSCSGQQLSQKHVTPMYQALCLIKEGNRQQEGEELLRLLVHSGADLNKHTGESDHSFKICETQMLTFDYVGGSCLHCALSLSSSDWDIIAEFLLQNGADPNIENDLHFTPLNCALNAGMFHKTVLLIRYGSIRNEKLHQFSPLNVMLRRAYKEELAQRYRSVIKRREFYKVVDLLLSSGLDLKGDTQLKESLIYLKHHGINFEEMMYIQRAYENRLHNPLSLYSLCRMSIRNVLGSNCNPTNIYHLNLPPVLSRYLNLSDIAD